MLEIAEETQTAYLSREDIESLFDEEFINQVQEEVDKLNPICSFIDSAQSKNCTLAESVHCWLGIGPIARNHQNWLKRDSMVCKMPGLIAYALNPVLRGARLSPRQKEEIKKFIYNNGRGEKALSDYEKFCSKEGLFGDEDFLSLDPANYWDLLQSDHAELSKIALQFVLLPASTASLERAFSMWSYVHNKIRNRLGLETSEKLLFCYHTINTLKK